MSKTVEVSVFVYEMNFGHGEPEYRVFNSDKQGDDWYTLIGPATLVYEIPASFNPVAAKIAALEEQERMAREDYLRNVAQLRERIAKLQALEMTGESA